MKPVFCNQEMGGAERPLCPGAGPWRHLQTQYNTAGYSSFWIPHVHRKLICQSKEMEKNLIEPNFGIMSGKSILEKVRELFHTLEVKAQLHMFSLK